MGLLGPLRGPFGPPLRIAASTGRERPASLTLGNRVEPVLVALPVRAATPSAAFAMVEGDPYMRKRVRETASSSNTGWNNHASNDSPTAEHGEAFSETRFSHQVPSRDVGRVSHGQVGAPSRDTLACRLPAAEGRCSTLRMTA